MPSLLKMKLKCDESINYNMSSLFHGFLMEKLPTDYVEFLHKSQLHPYTQHLELRDNTWFWVITCLDDTADKIIIRDFLLDLKYIKLKSRNISLSVGEKEYKNVGFDKLNEIFYKRTPERRINIDFITPTAFKRQGEYLFYPDIKCIYQSIMNKYDILFDKENMIDDDTLDELSNKTKIIRYKIRSVRFDMEGIFIPGFIGQITFKISGTDTLANFADFLFKFSEFSGIGIKTSLGMGSIRLFQKGELEND